MLALLNQDSRKESSLHRYVYLLLLSSWTYIWANSVDPDQMPQNAASDQGLHCLPLILQFYAQYVTGSKMG